MPLRPAFPPSLPVFSPAANISPMTASSQATEIPAGVSARPPIPVRRTPPAWERRLVPAILFVFCGCLLGVAAWLTPSSTGIGTHTQMGFPSCGMVRWTGAPCPTCGYTTTFSQAVHGQLWTAFTNQPAAFVLVFLAMATFLVCGYALVTGVSLGPLGRAIWRPWFYWSFAALFILGWAYKAAVMLMGNASL